MTAPEANKPAAIIVMLTSIGMMCTLIAGDIAKLSTWAEAYKPMFASEMLMHLGTVILAAAGGYMYPNK